MPGIEHCHWFILPLPLATPTMQFSLDRKRRSHKQNQCSASDSVGLIFTRSYRFTLLITTPTTTPSLVKTSLNRPGLTCCAGNITQKVTVFDRVTVKDVAGNDVCKIITFA